ncbi:MAG: TrkA family potassium uptake protein [Planctomycetia bacterium]|nr:TrkA family potassium uptake protein [Planctomycetia bacterium]MCC7315272.1 TrkA family potassium uptake protein [Planctomycetota bacterium]
MRQVAVIGLGQFGTNLARVLTELHCEVLAIDSNEARVAELRDDVHRVLIGDAREMEVLQSVVSSSIDEAVVSLGESMEASILCTLHLSQIGVKRIRTKAVNEDHALILKAVGAHDLIFPEKETAERTARRIAYPTLLDYFPFAEDYRIMELKMPPKLVGVTLGHSNIRSSYNLLLLATKSASTGQFRFMPGADDVLTEDDILIVLGQEVDLARFSVMD